MENTKTINIFFDYIFSNRFKKYIFFDLGSRDCLEAVEFSKKFPNAIIYSFEPNPSGQRQNRTADPLFFRYGLTF